jgi:hypothetical protein
MKSQQLVEIITDAVTDAVREALPAMIGKQLDALFQQAVAPQLRALESQVGGIESRTQERITALQADVATRGVAQCDALTTSWQREVTNLAESISDQVAKAVAAIPSRVGPAGPPGPSGRDATFLTPVHWKAGETFTRGALVQHKGGLWFANQDTSAEPGTGVDGYSLVIDGEQLAAFEYDARGYQVAVIRHASGVVRRVETGFRPMSYRGIYDHGTSYQAGDLVTANGSMWTCKAPEALGLRPGTDEAARAWQLTVKCGRDGAPGAPGPRGERGEQGPPGATVTRAPKQKANGVQA